MPSTRTEFWSEKIARNVARDAIVREQLVQSGWRFVIVWECALKGKTRLGIDEVIARIAGWLRGSEPSLEVEGVR